MAVNRIITVGLEKVHYCQQQIGLACITEAEMTFLKSYVHVMKPVLIAMDLLQSEQECCFGHVIPTIMGIQQKLKIYSDACLLSLVLSAVEFPFIKCDLIKPCFVVKYFIVKRVNIFHVLC